MLYLVACVHSCLAAIQVGYETKIWLLSTMVRLFFLPHEKWRYMKSGVTKRSKIGPVEKFAKQCKLFVYPNPKCNPFVEPNLFVVGINKHKPASFGSTVCNQREVEWSGPYRRLLREHDISNEYVFGKIIKNLDDIAQNSSEKILI